MLINYAVHGLTKIFKLGYPYHKTGVLLSRICSGSLSFRAICSTTSDKKKMISVQKAVDHINAVATRNKVQYACEGIEKSGPPGAIWFQRNSRDRSNN